MPLSTDGLIPAAFGVIAGWMLRDYCLKWKSQRSVERGTDSREARSRERMEER